MQRLAFADAMSYWTASAISNDQFVVYCFAEPQLSLDAIAERLLMQARHVDDLRLAVLDLPGTIDRPYWVPRNPDAGQIRTHTEVSTWSEYLTHIAGLMADQLVPSAAAWRLHVCGPLTGAPRCDGGAVVVVLQIAHALGDGRRTAQIARRLFTAPPEPIGALRRDSGVHRGVTCIAASVWGLSRIPLQVTEMVARGLYAWRLSTRWGPTAPGYAPSPLNEQPDAGRALRVLVVDRADLTGGGVSVTVAALTAISIALPAYLDDPDRSYGVELTIGADTETEARNNFRNTGVDLHTDVGDLRDRARRIADGIAAARRAGADPARRASRQASAATPPLLTHWGLRQFDPTRRPTTVIGITVVSSVDRGAADFAIGDAEDDGKVLFSTGFPALSPAQGLTHGVHGLGTAVALSVTTSPAVMPDVDRYAGLLADAITDVGAALRPGSGSET